MPAPVQRCIDTEDTREHDVTKRHTHTGDAQRAAAARNRPAHCD